MGNDIPVFSSILDLKKTLNETIASSGFALLKSTEFSEAIRKDDVGAVSDLFNLSPLSVKSVLVAPVDGRATIVQGHGDGALHVDSHPNYVPNIVLMTCFKKSLSGGQSIVLDSWKVADRAAELDPNLFAYMFLRHKKFAYPSLSTYAPTISIRNKSLTFMHSVGSRDLIGTAFQKLVDQEPKLSFFMEPGDTCVIDNNRMLHGRSAFVGDRLLQRTQVWLGSRQSGHSRFLEPAKIAQHWFEEISVAWSQYQKTRFGLIDCFDLSAEGVDFKANDPELDTLISQLPRPPSELKSQVLAAYIGRRLS
jgi:Taurine catabolism dioxygenase TauD, TfdA family